MSVNKNSLTGFIFPNYLITYLPRALYDGYSNNLLIMVTITDALGGINNVT